MNFIGRLVKLKFDISIGEQKILQRLVYNELSIDEIYYVDNWLNTAVLCVDEKEIPYASILLFPNATILWIPKNILEVIQ